MMNTISLDLIQSIISGREYNLFLKSLEYLPTIKTINPIVRGFLMICVDYSNQRASNR